MTRRLWPALIALAPATIADAALDRSPSSAVLDDFSPLAIEDLTPLPLPPGGLWDPTYPPPPDPPPAPLHWRVFFRHHAERDAARCGAAQPDAPHLTHRGRGCARRRLGGAIAASADRRRRRRVRRGAAVGPAGRRRRTRPSSSSSRRGVSAPAITPRRGCACARCRTSTSPDCDVLDLGTGSGVLAMAAALNGARRVVAVDVDPDAIEAARASTR